MKGDLLCWKRTALDWIQERTQKKITINVSEEKDETFLKQALAADNKQNKKPPTNIGVGVVAIMGSRVSGNLLKSKKVQDETDRRIMITTKEAPYIEILRKV